MMEVEKQTYIHIKMHESEHEKLINVLEQINNGASTLPDWVKAESIEAIRKLKKIK